MSERRATGSPNAGFSVAESHFNEVVRLLRDTATYAERPSQVLLRETHISCVFLTDRHAYKLKKPVAFEFVDFRTVESRRRACEEEVRLNRRLAGDVYLGVVPVTRDAEGQLRLGGEERAGEVQDPATSLVDWLVKMRRLPDDCMLDRLIERGRWEEAPIDRLAAKLVRFYRQAPSLDLEPGRYRAEIERHVRANRAELLIPEHGLGTPTVRRVHTAQLLLLAARPELLDARVRDGRVIEGHGDLRPEHVCLTDEPVVFDCLEFSPELRHLDVLDELGFFAMECDFLQAPLVGQRVLDAYCQEVGDRPPEGLLWFYQSYRACVRAKVTALRARQLTGPAAVAAGDHGRRYLQLADGYARRMSRPFVIVTRGASGSGKTTLARMLADALGVMRLGTDDVRRELFGPSPQEAPYGQGPYSPAARGAVYAEVFQRCRRLLEQGESMVLDGTFLSADLLRRVAELAASHGSRGLVLTCHCPAEVAQARIAARRAKGEDTSEALPEHRARQEADLERVPQGMPAIDVDTSGAARAEQMSVWLRPLLP